MADIGAAFEIALSRLNNQRYQHDPVGWVREVLGEEVWSKQAEIMEAVATDPLVAVQSCHGLGKTHLASRLIAWFIATHPVRHTMVVTTAPTSHQVRAVLWRYVRQAQEQGKLPGAITQAQVPEWKVDGNLVGYGRRPADHQQSSFQGQHAEHMLIVLDEAGGIPKWLWDAADSLMTGEDQHLLAIGNPDDNSSHFYNVCTSEVGWTRFQISAFDTPNLTGEPVTLEMSKRLVQRDWVEDKQVRWGVNSPLYQAKVLGEFVDSDDGLIPMSWVRAAHARWHSWNDAGAREVGGRRIIGVDVARYGDDDTAIVIREGDVIRSITRHSRMDTTQTTSLVEAELNFPQSVAIVDVIGVGAGVVDQLRSRGRRVQAFNAAQGTKRRDVTNSWKFRNCLTGDARVTPIGSLLRVYRSWHDGPLVRVHMASGDEFTVTPNHNVLTRSGWTSAQTLSVGDQLVDSGLGLRSGSADPEVQGVPATIREIYESVRADARVERVDGASVNFHGDVPVGEVEVVTVNRQLDVIDPPVWQRCDKFQLIGTLHGSGPLLSQSRGAQTVRPAWLDSSHRDAVLPSAYVSVSPLGVPFGGDRLSDETVGLDVVPNRDPRITQHTINQVSRSVDGPSYGHGRLTCKVSTNDGFSVDVSQSETGSRSLGSWLDTVFGQDTAYHAPVNAETLADRMQGLSGPVPTDNVVAVEIVPSSGHGGSWVYTMETTTGAYRSASTVHRNCRSAAWWNLRELLDPAAGATLALPEDDELTADLVTPQWRIGAGNTLIVESKDEMRKRLGRSTDSGDAVCMATWYSPHTGRTPDENDDRPRRPRVAAYADSQFASSWR